MGEEPETGSAPRVVTDSAVVDVKRLTATLPKPMMPGKMLEEKKKSSATVWNTKNLGLRIGADAVAAGAAGVLVAPIITMIDK